MTNSIILLGRAAVVCPRDSVHRYVYDWPYRSSVMNIFCKAKSMMRRPRSIEGIACPLTMIDSAFSSWRWVAAGMPASCTAASCDAGSDAVSYGLRALFLSPILCSSAVAASCTFSLALQLQSFFSLLSATTRTSPVVLYKPENLQMGIVPCERGSLEIFTS